jgi:histidinol-phosphate aminotransferase
MLDTVSQTLPLLDMLASYVRAMQPYTPGKPIDELKEQYGFDRVIKLASNENPFGASPMALKAVQRALTDTFRYPDPISRRLRRKIAETLKLLPNQLIVGAGSESLLACVIRTLVRPGEVALTGHGAFMGLAIHLSAHGGLLKTVPSPNYRFDIPALLDAMTPDIRILYLPNPNNPTGTYFTHNELQTILEAVPSTTLVLLDEAYIEFCQDYPDYPRSLIVQQDNLLILRTFSKAYGLAGFRIGYGIGHPQLIEQLTKVKMTFEPSLLAQVAAEAAWEDHAFLEQTVRNNRAELARYQTVLNELHLPCVPSAGNFVLVECPSPQFVTALNEALLQRGIAIRPLGPFGFPSAVRITVGLPDENDALFTALREILPQLAHV